MSIFEKFSLETNEYGAFYSGYLKLVEGLSIDEAWKKDSAQWSSLLAQLTEEKLHYSYAEGKWSVSRLMLHCFDAERIFAVRALRLLRGESAPQTGYDQDPYAENSPAEKQSVDDLGYQWNATRELTKSVFLHADRDKLRFIGNANGTPISARAIGLIIAGHNLHHLGALRDKYRLDF